MNPNELDFHIHSRKPFPEESAVMDAVEQARKQVGQVPGAAMFKGNVHVVAIPTVIPRAVDIIRHGMPVALERALAKGYVQVVVEDTQKVSQANVNRGSATKWAARKIDDTAESLKRMGFGT